MARYFDSASSQYLQDTTTAVNPFPVTISGWFRADALSDDCVASLCTDYNNNLFQVYVTSGNKLALYIEDNGAASTNQVGATTLSTGVWYQFVAISTGEDHWIYLNGSLDVYGNTVDLSFGAALNRTCIAHAVYSGSATNFFKGAIADVAFYNTNLAEGDAQALGAGYSPLMVSPNNLNAYFPLFDNDSDRNWYPAATFSPSIALTAYNSPTYATTHPPVIYPSRARFAAGSAGGGGSTIKSRRTIGGVRAGSRKCA